MHQEMCLNCKRNKAQRHRRGLCNRCHEDDWTRSLYPPAVPGKKRRDGKPNVRRRPVEAIIIVRPKGEPKPETEPAPVEKQDLGAWSQHWQRTDLELTEYTEPAAIAESQRIDVRRALRRHGSDVGVVSSVVCLPADIVKRRIKELRGKAR